MQRAEDVNENNFRTTDGETTDEETERLWGILEVNADAQRCAPVAMLTRVIFNDVISIATG